MGHVVSPKGIATDPEKVKAIKEFPEPMDVSTLCSFLGCAGHDRQFMRNFTDIAFPRYDLERKGSNLKWTTTCQTAFNTLKERQTSSLIDRPFIYSGYWCQRHWIRSCAFSSPKWKGKMIAYTAKALSKPQSNYSTTRKELLALVWGMERFEPYFLGREFVARTDCNALTWLRNFKQPKGQVACWLED